MSQSETASSPASEGTPGRVCIVSRNTVQVFALCAYLSQELDGGCSHHTDPTTCLNAALLNATPTVLLFDCSVIAPKDVLELLSAGGSSNPGHVLPAMMNVSEENDIEWEAIHWGIRGFFYLGQTPEILLKGIRALLSGDAWISRRTLLDAAFHNHRKPDRTASGRDQLTTREVEILAMICLGLRNEEIASKICISTSTVKSHIYHIYKKINVPNRTQAALWAAKNL